MRLFSTYSDPSAEQVSSALSSMVITVLKFVSLAADIILAHSMVNGNVPLSDKLIEKGVVVTLEHLTIALKV